MEKQFSLKGKSKNCLLCELVAIFYPPFLMSTNKQANQHWCLNLVWRQSKQSNFILPSFKLSVSRKQNIKYFKENWEKTEIQQRIVFCILKSGRRISPSPETKNYMAGHFITDSPPFCPFISHLSLGVNQDNSTLLKVFVKQVSQQVKVCSYTLNRLFYHTTHTSEKIGEVSLSGWWS